MAITIRMGTGEDIPALISIVAEFAEFHGSSHEMSNTADRMRQEQDAFISFVAVAETGQIVGYAICFFAYYTWSWRSLYLDDLFVQEAYRGQQIGKNLLATIVDYAKRERCQKVRWQVSRWNTPAQEFYTKFGAVIDDVELNCDLKLS